MKKKLVFGLLFAAASFFAGAQEGLPKLLPAEVNSGNDEWAPAVSPEGKALYFSRLGHMQNMGETDAADIWIAYRYPNGQWSGAVNAGAPLNSRQAEHAVAVHASGRRLYLYQPDSFSLSYSNRKGRAWQPPVPIRIDSFSLDGKSARFSFSSDGSVLLIAAEHEGSRGGKDIYASFAIADNQYAPPKNLGPQVNSGKDEIGLFLAADDKSLYFSSGRPGGQGGQDFYLTRRLDDSWTNWSPPVNLGPAVNTGEDDLFLSMPASGYPVYLLRQNGEGATDIYETKLPDSLLPDPVILLAGAIKDATSGQALEGAKARLHPLEQDSVLAGDEFPDYEGDFQLILPQGHDFMLSANLNGYFPVSERLELSGKVLEDLDPGNLLLLASLNRDLAYAQRNEEIINLQLHLRELDDELIAINEQRRALKQAIAGHRLKDPGWKPLSDPELDALRHRYQQYRATGRDTIIPPSYEEIQGQSQEELADMKERYDRYVQYQKQQQAAEVKQDAEYLWEDEKSFESFEQEARQGLEEELAHKVSQELSASMLEEVKGEVASTLSERERQQLVLKEEALRRDIRQSFSAPAGRPEGWAAKGQVAETEWERQLKGNLKTAMEPKVREALQEELKDDIRAALRNDITYWAKKETQAELQAELNEKLQMQIEQEKRKAMLSSAEAESIAPLTPAPAPQAEYREIRQDLLLVRAEPGKVIPLNTVVFEPEKPSLKPASYAELEEVAAFLKHNKRLVVEIGVHCGGQLSHANALSLSTQRAKAITNFLIGHGIDESRLSHKGYGKAFPKADNNTAEGQRLNQRVEMRIISTAG